ncbi:hypothetical protein [Terrisporobacter sp.]
MRKGIIPITLGTAVTAAGIALDSKQACSHKLKRNDCCSLIGTFTLGLGVAHILLGAIYMGIDEID